MESPETAEHAGPGLWPPFARCGLKNLCSLAGRQMPVPETGASGHTAIKQTIMHYCREYGHIRCYNCRFVTIVCTLFLFCL